MNRIPVAMAALLSCALLATPAGAQRIDSPYRFVEHSQTLGAFGGWLRTQTGPTGAGPQSGTLGGARYGIRFSGPFNGEVDVFAVPTTRMVFDTSLVAGEFREVGEVDATLVGALASLRFNITGPRTWHGIQPYLTFGGGVVLDLSGRPALEEDEELGEDVRYRFGTRFAGQLGAGAEWFLSDRLSLRADARGLLWRSRTPPAFRVGERGQQVPADEWNRHDFIAVGIGYHF